MCGGGGGGREGGEGGEERLRVLDSDTLAVGDGGGGPWAAARASRRAQEGREDLGDRARGEAEANFTNQRLIYCDLEKLPRGLGDAFLLLI